MKRYEKYKESNVAWLGCIPEHWEQRFLFQCAAERKSSNKGMINQNLLSLSYGRIIRKNIDTTSGLLPDSFETYQVVQKGDVIMRLTDLQNDKRSLRTGLVKEVGIITSAYVCLNPKIDVNSNFFHYLLHCYDVKKLFYSLGGGLRQGCAYADLKKVVINLPTEDEQEQIVKYLDWKVALADKFVADRRKLIELLKEYRQAEINKAVTKGLNHDAPMRNSGIDWIGDVPAHWVKYSLSQATEEYKCSNKYIQNNNLLSLSYGEVISKDINKTDGLLPASFNNYQVVKHGIIVLRLTDLQNDQKSLRVGLSKKEGILTSAYTYLKCKDYVSPEFTHLLLHSYDIRKVFYGMGGGLRQSLSYQELRKLSLFAPSQAEQQQIAAYLDTISERVKKAIEDIEQQIKLVVEYKTTLISHVVTGKVDVRGIEIQKI
ncbi:MAG: restriction endonuclease subunit S [Rikenellaceae bacterium]